MDGHDICFLGIVISNENVTLKDKERSSSYAAKLAQMLGADAAIVSEEGFGNPDADLIMNCNKLESYGIKTVLLPTNMPDATELLNPWPISVLKLMQW
jgi:sarcosine reductase